MPHCRAWTPCASRGMAAICLSVLHSNKFVRNGWRSEIWTVDIRKWNLSAKFGSLQGLVAKFAEHQQIWNQVMWCVAELDALMSLALAAEEASAWGPICQPEFETVNDNQPQVKLFRTRQSNSCIPQELYVFYNVNFQVRWSQRQDVI